MSTTQKIALAAGVAAFLVIGVIGTVFGGNDLGRVWGGAAGAGLVVYGLTAFGLGIAQGAAEARRERQGRK